MRRFLFYYILGMILLVVVVSVAYSQEQKPLTQEKRIENLTRSLLNMKFNFAEEKALFAKEKNMNASEMKITVQLQDQVMRLQNQAAKLEKKLKRVNEQSSKKVEEYEKRLGESNGEIVLLASNLEKLNQKYGVLLIQSQELMTEKIELEEKLKIANAWIVQLEMKAVEIHPYDVAPGEAIDVPKDDGT
ncbi:hypothetical protein LCGC14_0775680 [marine sediment metagenome]|uniref:Uncharacterized protein n=1 Tax=marine sediment metagenome TaxID=412755 RepID=A0A0F9T3Z3_9ZZZZ